MKKMTFPLNQLNKNQYVIIYKRYHDFIPIPISPSLNNSRDNEAQSRVLRLSLIQWRAVYGLNQL